MSHEEMSFCELRSKEIVNEVDGRKLGKACDMVFSPRTGCILGIVAPYNRRGFFFKGQEIYIPFKNIVKIGPDVVLVRLAGDLSHPDACVDMGRGKGRGGRGGGGGGQGGKYGYGFDDDHGHDDHGHGHGHDEHDGHGHGHDGHGHGHGHDIHDGCGFKQNQSTGFGAGAGEFCDARNQPPPASAGCDFKCEKCMLFDCSHRWKGGASVGI